MINKNIYLEVLQTMSFIKDIPDYKNYQSDNYNMTIVPDSRELWDTLEAYAARADSLRSVVNRLEDIALIPQSKNWGRDWILGDLSDAIKTIKNKSVPEDVPLFMDAIAIIVNEAKIDLTEMNAFLQKQGIGYEIYEILPDVYVWCVREDAEKLSDSIDDTIQVIQKSDFEQAVEHLQQAKKQLKDAANERSRKDAVRDCASAMESIVNILGGTKDIGDSTKSLKETKLWGLDDIVKDGNLIFGRLHILYPDFRHGSTEMSTMSLNEAMYWVGRITIFIDYIVRQKNELGL